MKKEANYIDNKKFLQALIDYKETCKIAEESNKDTPIVTEYLGECFIKISTHLSYKMNFINYTFKDDMISDGIENCLVAVRKFDPTKSENPFAYFTQIVFYAFVRRIQKEKRQQVTKYKMMENFDLEEIITQEQDFGDFDSQILDNIRKQMEYLDIEKKHNVDRKQKVPEVKKTSLNFDEL